MSSHDPHTLWALWQHEKITGGMATGHIIQNLLKQPYTLRSQDLRQNAQAATNLSLVQLQNRVKTQQAAVETLRGDMERLQAIVARLETTNTPEGTRERLMAQSGLTPDSPDERQSAQTG